MFSGKNKIKNTEHLYVKNTLLGVGGHVSLSMINRRLPDQNLRGLMRTQCPGKVRLQAKGNQSSRIKPV